MGVKDANRLEIFMVSRMLMGVKDANRLEIFMVSCMDKQ